MPDSTFPLPTLRPEFIEIKAILEAAGTMVVATDLAGIIWVFNPAAERLLGWSAEEVIGKQTPALWHVADELVSRAADLSRKLGREIQPGPEYFQTLLLNGDHQPSVWTVVRKDGTKFRVQLVMAALKDGEGRVAGFVGTAQDLTVRINFESELEHRALESERFSRATLDALSAHIVVIEPTGKIVSTNRSWRQFAKANGGGWMSISEGANYLEVCDHSAADGDQDAAIVAKGIRQVIAGEIETWFHEYPCHSDIEQRWFSCRITKNVHDEWEYVVIAHECITARKLAEQALKLSEMRHSTLLKTAIDAVVTIDETGIVQSFNDAAERWFGYSANEIIGQNVRNLMPSPYRNEHDDYLKRYHETGVRRVIGIGREVVGQRKDGTTFPLELTVSEVDHLGIYMGILRDISHRKQLEREIVEVASLEQQRIGQDLHDTIGQQLTGTILLCQALSETVRANLPEENKQVTSDYIKSCQKLYSQAQRLQSGVEEALQNIRDICRELSPIPMRADGLIAAIEQLVAKTSSQSSVVCTLDCPSSISPLDNLTATHLFNITQGALSNALRHAQASRIQIRIEQTRDQLLLSIRDDGIGLPPLCHPGMGMRIMHNRAQIIGGSLMIRSVEPSGTEVTCICGNFNHQIAT